MQKNSSVHKFILDRQQILESNIIATRSKKIIQVTVSFPKFVSVCK